jgi:GntR family transcriptional regulator
MVNVKLDRGDAATLHDQVAAEIRRAIAEREVRSGERLPPARDLAAVLGVHTNTVLRAFRLLRDEGLLELRRGRGATVTGTPERSAILEQARALVVRARAQGYRTEDIVRLFQDVP